MEHASLAGNYFVQFIAITFLLQYVQYNVGSTMFSYCEAVNVLLEFCNALKSATVV